MILSGDYYMFNHDENEGDLSFIHSSDSMEGPDFLVNAISSVMETTEKKEDEPPKSIAQKLVGFAQKVKKLSITFVTYCARRLFEISRNQIYVLQVLSEEKKLLKVALISHLQFFQYLKI